jgi:hypothetical protein
MKTNVKTTGRVRRLATTVSKMLGQSITLMEHQNGKEYQLMVGATIWPLHTLTIREAGLALELIAAAVASGVIKIGVMGFTLTPAPISIQEQYRRDMIARFDRYVDMLTQNELYWCMRSMDEQLTLKNHPAHHHIRAFIKNRKYVYEKHNEWYPVAEQNVRYFICAYRELAMVYMTTSKRFPV